MAKKESPKLVNPQQLLKQKDGMIIIESSELKGILDSLLECHEMIEDNTRGLVVDEKDTARIYLTKWGYKYSFQKGRGEK